MRFFEISSGVRMMMNEEERDMLALVIERRRLPETDLNERGAEVARLMVSRGLLLHREGEDGSFYEPNSATDIWRF